MVNIGPGTYPEQAEITFPVTLEGISDGTSTGATTTVPSGELKANATDPNDEPLAVHVLVENAGGDVNLTNLTIDGTQRGKACEPPGLKIGEAETDHWEACCSNDSRGLFVAIQGGWLPLYHRFAGEGWPERSRCAKCR